MMLGNDMMRQTRRRFRYNQTAIADRVNITNKQRIYKQILDDQLEQKRRRQSHEKPKAAEERAWYVNPEDSYHPQPLTYKTPKAIKNPQTHQQEEERPGYSQFLTDPKEAKQDTQEQEDGEVKEYLEECEKILINLKGLAARTSPVPSHKSIERRFIKLNRSRNLLSNSNLNEIEDRYNRNYANKLPQLSLSNLQSKNRRDRMAIIVNPMPSTHKMEPYSEQEQAKKSTKLIEMPKSVPLQHSIEKLDVSDVKSPPLAHSRNSSIQQEINQQKNENPQFSYLIERSKKSQLQLNKSRVNTLHKDSLHQQHHKSLPVNNQQKSPAKSGQKIMTHLVRVKAHGYKLFEKMQKYKRRLSVMHPEIKQV